MHEVLLAPILDGAHHKQIHGPHLFLRAATCLRKPQDIAICLNALLQGVTHIVLSEQYLGCRSCRTLLQVSGKE